MSALEICDNLCKMTYINFRAHILCSVLSGGVTPHLEWCAISSLPLALCLESRLKPANYRLPMQTCSERAERDTPVLEVAVRHCAKLHEKLIVEQFRCVDIKIFRYLSFQICLLTLFKYDTLTVC